MKHYVYKIVNSNNEIEYIGETKNPTVRLRHHICKNGKFSNRKDVSLEIIKECKGKKSAFNYQCKLQKELGFETDREKSSRNMKEIQKKTTERKRIPILCYDLNGNLIGEYPSILSAERELTIHNSLIWNVIHNKQKSTKGFVFKRLENI
jgi:predicted GIY-YIG superfamily endonuclease